MLDSYYQVLLDKLQKPDQEGKAYVYVEFIPDLINVSDLINRIRIFTELTDIYLRGLNSCKDELANVKKVNSAKDNVNMGLDQKQADKQLLDFHKSNVLHQTAEYEKASSNKYKLFIQLQSILSNHGILVKAEDMKEVLKKD